MRLRSIVLWSLALALLAATSCTSTAARRQASPRTDFVELRCGMDEAEVTRELGSKHDADGSGAGYYDWWYPDRSLIVTFNDRGKVIGVSVPKGQAEGAPADGAAPARDATSADGAAPVSGATAASAMSR